MKIKRDFVTNSSSVSFLIGNKNSRSKNLKVKLELEYDLYNLIAERITSLKEFYESEIYKDEYWLNITKREECIKILKEGGEILLLNASNEDGDPIELLLYNEGLKKFITSNKNLIIIDEDED